MKPVLGIVGGMGSHAAVSFFQQLVSNSPVVKDQDYIEVLIHNNTRIPDRTQGILFGGEDPLPELLRSVKMLESCGASTIVLACITAYYFSDEMQKSLEQAKIYNILRSTVERTYSQYPETRSVGIIASSGAIKTNLWQAEFQKKGIKTIVLPEEYQEEYFNQVIYGSQSVKAGYISLPLKKKMQDACEMLVDMGADVLIGGCSELPLIISDKELKFPYIDSIGVAVEDLISQYYNNLPERKEGR